MLCGGGACYSAPITVYYSKLHCKDLLAIGMTGRSFAVLINDFNYLLRSAKKTYLVELSSSNGRYVPLNLIWSHFCYLSSNDVKSSAPTTLLAFDADAIIFVNSFQNCGPLSSESSYSYLAIQFWRARV